jgi:heme exporter protein D
MGQESFDSGSGGGALMQWGSVGEFLAMGGYGVYVWTSFGVTALCMVWEVLAVRRRHAVAAAESRGLS